MLAVAVGPPLGLGPFLFFWGLLGFGGLGFLGHPPLGGFGPFFFGWVPLGWGPFCFFLVAGGWLWLWRWLGCAVLWLVAGGLWLWLLAGGWGWWLLCWLCWGVGVWLDAVAVGLCWWLCLVAGGGGVGRIRSFTTPHPQTVLSDQCVFQRCRIGRSGLAPANRQPPNPNRPKPKAKSQPPTAKTLESSIVFETNRANRNECSCGLSSFEFRDRQSLLIHDVESGPMSLSATGSQSTFPNIIVMEFALAPRQGCLGRSRPRPCGPR